MRSRNLLNKPVKIKFFSKNKLSFLLNLKILFFNLNTEEKIKLSDLYKMLLLILYSFSIYVFFLLKKSDIR